jgi:PadR family transcriptional regulator
MGEGAIVPTEASSLYGNLALLILRVLQDGRLHGLGIARRIRAQSGEVLQVEEGALYPALHRLRRDRLVMSEWGLSEQNRRARYYELTVAGRQRLETDLEAWRRHTAAISRVLDAPAG